MNPTNPKQVYHMTLSLKGEPLFFSPINRSFVPDVSQEGLFLLYLEDATNDRTNFQVNYRGRSKPFSSLAIQNQLKKERKSRAYHNLDDAVLLLKPQLFLNEPIELTEDKDALVLYQPDERGLPKKYEFSIVTFGERYPLDREGANLKVRYAGEHKIFRLSDLSDLPEVYHFLIRSGVNEINESLRDRFDNYRYRRRHPRPKPEKNGGGEK